MALAAGSRLGAYRIVALLGAGGMGEVYRALDTDLKRDVAIKVLPASFADDPDRLARFRREAEVLASLNHPNIAHVHGLEKSEGTIGLVMELIEGPTLADRIADGPIPLDAALPIARQIAEALEAAHDQGIVHRDLKPANIKVRDDGTVKVLDFGLAKFVDATMVGVPGSQMVSTAPTITTPAATMLGVVLGTPAYMAPEQARGRAADHRADVWAFGVVLYEMLTGRRTFTGDDLSTTLASVLKSEPDWGALPVDTPAILRQVIVRCLKKDPKQRLQAMGDARIEIADLVNAPLPHEGLPLPGLVATPLRRWLVFVVAGSMTAVLTAVIIGRFADRPAGLQPLVRLGLDLPLGDALSFGPQVIISPDGSRLMYVADNRLVTRRLSESQEHELATTEGASDPFFSPDGRWVGFFADGKLKKVSVDGGAAIPLADAPTSYGGSWGDNDIIVAKVRNAAGLVQIPASGGTPAALTTLAPGEQDHNWPQILPGGKAVLFSANTAVGAWNGGTVEIMSLVDRQRKTLIRNATFGRYLTSGHLVYVNSGTLFAVRFDPDTWTVRGAPVPVLDGVAYSTTNGGAQFAAAATGALVYQTGALAELFTVQWVDRAGTLQPLVAIPDVYVSPRLSPDGTKLAAQVRRDVFVFGLNSAFTNRLTFDGGFYPVWTPDSQYVVMGTSHGMSWTRGDGSALRGLTESANIQWPFSMTSDGGRLAFQERNTGTGWDVWTVSIDHSDGGLRAGTPEKFLAGEFDESTPSFSHDGQWIAYTSNEKGSNQVWVAAFPSGPKYQVSHDGGRQPIWSLKTHELLFRGSDGHIVTASYEVAGNSLTFHTPQVWSDVRIANVNNNGVFDVASDGRIAALLPVVGRGPARSRVVYVDHFFDEVRRLAPRGRP